MRVHGLSGLLLLAACAHGPLARSGLAPRDARQILITVAHVAWQHTRREWGAGVQCIGVTTQRDGQHAQNVPAEVIAAFQDSEPPLHQWNSCAAADGGWSAMAGVTHDTTWASSLIAIEAGSLTRMDSTHVALEAKWTHRDAMCSSMRGTVFMRREAQGWQVDSVRYFGNCL